MLSTRWAVMVALIWLARAQSHEELTRHCDDSRMCESLLEVADKPLNSLFLIARRKLRSENFTNCFSRFPKLKTPVITESLA